MTVQLRVISSPSSRQMRKGFSSPELDISDALKSSWRLRSDSKAPLDSGGDCNPLAYFTALGPATKPPKMHDTSEFAPRRLAPWYPYSHSPAAKIPGILVAWLKSTHRPPMV